MQDDQWDPGDPPEVHKKFKGLNFKGLICGEDFCEDCGDCLVCYGEDDCTVTGEPHRCQF
jgi:hypothetical protein